MGSIMKNNLETLMEYLLAEAREPSQRDILDAIEHVKEVYPEEIDQDAGIEDFDKLFDAYEHCVYRGKCSKSSGPIVVVETEDGKYQLIDGYHRLIEHLLDRGGATPLRAIIGGEGSGEYAIARGGERWVGDASLRYGNLEDLTDEDTLDSHVKRRKMQKSLKNVK